VDLISVIVVLVIVGFALYLLKAFVPMDPAVKSVLTAVVVILLILWLLQMFVGTITIPRLR
jgi:hypothetical protein